MYNQCGGSEWSATTNGSGFRMETNANLVHIPRGQAKFSQYIYRRDIKNRRSHTHWKRNLIDTYIQEIIPFVPLYSWYCCVMDFKICAQFIHSTMGMKQFSAFVPHSGHVCMCVCVQFHWISSRIVVYFGTKQLGNIVSNNGISHLINRSLSGKWLMRIIIIYDNAIWDYLSVPLSLSLFLAVYVPPCFSIETQLLQIISLSIKHFSAGKKDKSLISRAFRLPLSLMFDT